MVERPLDHVPEGTRSPKCAASTGSERVFRRSPRSCCSVCCQGTWWARVTASGAAGLPWVTTKSARLLREGSVSEVPENYRPSRRAPSGPAVTATSEGTKYKADGGGTGLPVLTRRAKPITIAEIARQSGLSSATVSKVLNGRPDVSARTRALVQDIIVTRGYRRRGAGGVGESPVVDVVFNDFDSPWAVELVRGAMAAAQAAGVTIALTALSEAGERRVWFDHITSRGTRGIILLLYQLTARQRAELAARQLPIVVVDPSTEPGPEVSSVGATNWSGGLAATKHLIELGHERIGIITGPGELLCSRARLDGYRAGLETAGLSVDGELVRSADFRVQGGYQHAKALLGLRKPPTAIFAGNDLSALGVLRAAREASLRVPDQLSVVGFDDLPLSAWTTPALTTVHQPLTEMSALAVRLLLESEGAAIHRRVELATDLVVRESTAPPLPPSPPRRANER